MKASEKVYQYTLPIKISPQKDGGFVAVCLNWDACYAQGDTIDEVILEITAVAQSLIELYREEELKIPLKLQKEKGMTSNISVPVIVSA